MQQDQNSISESLEKLQKLLEKLFRADAADLDFGIYRIINYRRDQFENFIDKELPDIVKNALEANTDLESAHKDITEKEDKVREFSRNLGEEILDADGKLVNEKYKDTPVVKDFFNAKENLESPQTRDQREDVVYNHLYTFFSRYYDNGDFIPRRRYSQTERYAVPYNGEEVYLHWANRDQYYVKSGEHFSDYRFKSNNITVIFDLRDVDIEKDNVKGAKRFFIPLSAETNYNAEIDEVCIPFEYRPLTDEEKSHYGKRDQQDKIVDEAEQEIIAHLGNYNIQSELGHEKDGITPLKQHLRTYTRRNTADFFIHKNLEQFLNREFDVYIKNRVMPLSSLIFDDVNFQDDNLTRVNWIETSKLVHSIASKIIIFLAHIEEFQKRLWLKKKFVLSTDYCLTLDRVPEEFYPGIIENTAQLEEWKNLFAIHEIDGNLIGADYTKPLSVGFLKENPNLVLDTCHFGSDFKDCLLAHFDDLDNETDGLLIHGENFQGLNLLTEKYSKSIKSIYIDPPYNTNASAILYKNNYKDSSWMSLMADRILVSQGLLADNGIFCVAIDDVEAANLRLLLQNLFGKENELGIVAVFSNPSGNASPTGFASAHEYVMFFGITEASLIGRLEWTDEQLKSYNNIDEKGKFKWTPLRRGEGPNNSRTARPRLFYPLFVKNDRIRIPNMEWNNEDRNWLLLESPSHSETVVWPIKNDDEKELSWRYGVETLREKLSELSVKSDRSGNVLIHLKWYLKNEGVLPKTLWNNNLYAAPRYGTSFLKNMIGDVLAFPFPKSIHLMEDCLRVASLTTEETVLDYFGGSGTTAHATINLNRQDNGKRKYILVEMGHHFDAVLKPRIKKAVYAEKWKDAKPVSRESRFSHMFKYQRIESYEDALNNIKFNETEHRNLLLEEHQLSYMLESGTRESPTFLNISELQNPYSYQLNIVKDMQTQTQTIDLPETFNYLLGLSVQTRRCLHDEDRSYLVYRGTVGQKTVVIIWRETAEWEQKDWERDYNFIQEQELIKDASEVYVNTNSIVAGAKPLDPLFKRLMFSQ